MYAGQKWKVDVEKKNIWNLKVQKIAFQAMLLDLRQW